MIIAYVENKVMNPLMKFKSKAEFERSSITVEFIDNAPLTAKIVYNGMEAEISTYTRYESASMNKLQQHGMAKNGEVVVDKGDENTVKIAYAIAEGINRIIYDNKWVKRCSALDESKQGILFSLGENKNIRAEIVEGEMRPALLCKTVDGNKRMIRPYTEIQGNDMEPQNIDNNVVEHNDDNACRDESENKGPGTAVPSDEEINVLSGVRFFVPDEFNQSLISHYDDLNLKSAELSPGDEFCVDLIEQPIHFKVSCVDGCTELKLFVRKEVGIFEDDPDIVYKKFTDGRSPESAISDQHDLDPEETGEIYLKVAAALKQIVQSKGLLSEFDDMDIEDEGILASVDGEEFIFNRVSGKKRPSIACDTLFGSIQMTRPYSDELFDSWNMEEKTPNELAEMAEGGDTAAMLKLAVSYLNGEQGFDEDPKKAAYWMEKAAQGGDEEAQFNIGLFYAKGYGVERDFGKMTEWMKRAADNDDEDAERFLNEFESVSEDFKKAEGGDPVAQAAVAEGLMKIGTVLDQAGSERDFKESVKWAEKAVAQGNTDAFWTLALAYQHGRGVDIDMDKAIEYYRKGSDAGNPACQHNLGCEYMSGMNLEKNERKGFELIKAAAEQGYGLAMRDLGRCYQFANGTPGNMKTAVEWYEKALEVIDDPELERKTAMFKMMADMDPDFEEDYPETPSDEDEMDVSNLPDGYMDALKDAAKEIDSSVEDDLESDETLSGEGIMDSIQNGQSGFITIPATCVDESKKEIAVWGGYELDGFDRTLNVFMKYKDIGFFAKSFLEDAVDLDGIIDPCKVDQGFQVTVDYLDFPVTSILRRGQEKVTLDSYVRDERKSFSTVTDGQRGLIELEKDGSLYIDIEKMRENKFLLDVYSILGVREYLLKKGIVQRLYDMYDESSGVIVGVNGEEVSARIVKGAERPDLPCQVLFLGKQMCRPYIDEALGLKSSGKRPKWDPSITEKLADAKVVGRKEEDIDEKRATEPEKTSINENNEKTDEMETQIVEDNGSREKANRIMEAVKSARLQAYQADKLFERRKKEIEDLTQGSIDLFGESVIEDVSNIASVVRTAFDDMYTSNQALVQFVDDACKPLISDNTHTKAIVEVSLLIGSLNNASELSANYRASINGENKREIASVNYVPSIENKVIQKYWEQQMESRSDYLEYIKVVEDQYNCGWLGVNDIPHSRIIAETPRDMRPRQYENNILKELIMEKLNTSPMTNKELFYIIQPTWEGDDAVTITRITAMLRLLQTEDGRVEKAIIDRKATFFVAGKSITADGKSYSEGTSMDTTASSSPVFTNGTLDNEELKRIIYEKLQNYDGGMTSEELCDEISRQYNDNLLTSQKITGLLRMTINDDSTIKKIKMDNRYKYIIPRPEQWRSQGRCQFCGGELKKGFMSTKCLSCGWKN